MFGAEVTDIDLRSGLSGKQIQAIQTAFSEYIVLVFRDQDFEIDTFEVFAQYLGPFGYTPFITPVEGHPNVLRV